MSKIYYWKKTKNLKIYIIIFAISIIIWCIIKWDISIYFIVIPILTLPLFVLLITDYIKTNKFKIELNNDTLKIRNEKWEKFEITYNEILIIYNILYSSINVITSR